jgi:hypothetical protein
VLQHQERDAFGLVGVFSIYGQEGEIRKASIEVELANAITTN